MKIDDILSIPTKLSDNNFTSLTETPWAGAFIKNTYKSHLAPTNNIGESWELSWGPKKPSHLTSANISLKDLANETLKHLKFSSGKGVDLLVKLLSSAENLSIQMHPDYDDKKLEPHECGKHESWLVLDAKPGAGFYLGLKPKITKRTLVGLLQSKNDLSLVFNFIPAKTGDFFDIPPGTIHAIGKGLTVLEPQRVIWGKEGKTFRLWDWNRKYNEEGKLDYIEGKERTLHIKECLERLDLKKQRLKQIEGLKKKATTQKEGSFGIWQAFPANPYFRLHLLELNPGSYQLDLDQAYMNFLNLKGGGKFINKKSEVSLESGGSYLLTHKASPLTLKINEKISAVLTVPTPAKLKLEAFS